jgi:hypothetical protein
LARLVHGCGWEPWWFSISAGAWRCWKVEPVDVDHGDSVLRNASDLLGFGGVEELRAKA